MAKREPPTGKKLANLIAKMPRWMKRYRAQLTRTVPCPGGFDANGKEIVVQIPYSEWAKDFGAGGSITGPMAKAAYLGSTYRQGTHLQSQEPSPSPEDPAAPASPPRSRRAKR